MEGIGIRMGEEGDGKGRGMKGGNGMGRKGGIRVEGKGKEIEGDTHRFLPGWTPLNVAILSTLIVLQFSVVISVHSPLSLRSSSL